MTVFPNLIYIDRYILFSSTQVGGCYHITVLVQRLTNCGHDTHDWDSFSLRDIVDWNWTVNVECYYSHINQISIEILLHEFIKCKMVHCDCIYDYIKAMILYFHFQSILHWIHIDNIWSLNFCMFLALKTLDYMIRVHIYQIGRCGFGHDV